LEECATLLNIDVANQELMDMVYDTAFAIKNRIYGNRIVLFAPLYIANYCVNNCTYCAFRAGNKNLQVRGSGVGARDRHGIGVPGHHSNGQAEIVSD
jgi:2-iminoacetate synthase ThiH